MIIKYLVFLPLIASCSRFRGANNVNPVSLPICISGSQINGDEWQMIISEVMRFGKGGQDKICNSYNDCVGHADSKGLFKKKLNEGKCKEKPFSDLTSIFTIS